MKILIVEDDSISRSLMQKILTSYGECDIAENGKEGVKAYKSAIDSGVRYDLVCLDILMPEMDGQEALIKIRQIEKEKGIKESEEAKIIMTTALNDPESIVNAFYKGNATAYIVKPVTREKLNEKLHKLGLIQ